jgi:hypothetical protein
MASAVKKARKEVAVVLALPHAMRAHEVLSCSNAHSGYFEVIHGLFEDGVFVGHDQSILTGSIL